MPLRRPLASSLSRIPPRPWRRDALAAFCVAVALAACGSEPPPVPSERGDVEAARPPPAGGPVSAPPEAGPVSPPPGSGPVSAPPASPVDPPTAGPEEAPPDAAPPPTTGDSRADATHTLPDVPILRALRIGEQPGADRIVFEFDGDGLPAWFDCGMAAYSYEAKQALLGVRPETLTAHGAVSHETVLEMVSGALVTSGASIAVAVTGIAGPTGGLPGKPVGTVWIGWKRRGGYPRAQLFHFSGDREAVRRQTVDAALRGLLALAG